MALQTPDQGNGSRPIGAKAADRPAWGEEALRHHQKLIQGRGALFALPLERVREQNLQRFLELGFPTTRHEEWRFTSVAPLAQTAFQLPSERESLLPSEIEPLAALFFGGLAGPRVVLVNGRFQPALSSLENLPAGITVRSLAEALEGDPDRMAGILGQYSTFTDHAFANLNGAAFEDGVLIESRRGALGADPIHLLYVATSAGVPVVSHPRTLVLAESQSQVTLIEAYTSIGAEPTWANAFTEITLGEGAVVDHYKVQRQGEQGFNTAAMQVHLARSSVFSSHAFTLGGSLVRNDVRATVDGEGAECTLNGLYLGTGRQLIDNHTVIDHAQPHCPSHEVYHGVLDGDATGVFNGKIFVRPHAQKTDAKQTNRTLLLSDRATIDSKPQLEIFADDVRCTHGATVGHLDQDVLFYLRARGLPRAQAQDLLTFAFCNEIVERVRIEALRRALEAQIFDWLAKAQHQAPPGHADLPDAIAGETAAGARERMGSERGVKEPV